MTVQTPSFGMAEQFESPQRKAIGAEQWEGGDGVLAGGGTKIIQLLPSIKIPSIVTGNAYWFDLEWTALASGGGVSARKQTAGGRWSGAAWDGLGQGDSLAKLASGAIAFPASSDLEVQHVGGPLVRLLFSDDKNETVYFWWRATLHIINTSFPLLP
jgi:hypothetical protein